MQHDTTTHNKVVKRYKLFLHNKCCMLLHEKLGSFDRGFRTLCQTAYLLSAYISPMTIVLLTDLGLRIPLSFIDQSITTSVDLTIY